MYARTLQLPKNRSLFLFGARGTGKSTLLRDVFPEPKAHRFDLLDLNEESKLARDPMSLAEIVLSLPTHVTHVIINEIQKIPKLLDVVHYLIESKKVPQKFILTGSSARKLKRGGGNLLAGRAVLRSLFPLLQIELGADFDLSKALRWGGLPEVWNSKLSDERDDFLRSYANAYIKEEIWAEQIVRNLDPFRRFTEIAARQSGKILSANAIAKDVGADSKSIQSWYQILEDTLLGFHVDSFHTSVRKQLRSAAKFYFFDVGVTRALAQMLEVVPSASTSYFGDLFEQLVMTEIFARNQYSQNDYRMTYLRTKAGVEVDCILERPGKELAFIELKSTNRVKETDAKNLHHFRADFPKAEMFLFSDDPTPRLFDDVRAMHWTRGLLEI